MALKRSGKDKKGVKDTGTIKENGTEKGKKDSAPIKASSAEDLLAGINKRYGAGTITRLGDKPAMNVETISTGSLALDLSLGVNGLPKGRIIEMFGPESGGKTTLALHACREAQKEGLNVAFVDVEHALDPAWAQTIGVDTDNLIVTQPNSGDQALNITADLVKSGQVGLIIVDSVAALTPEKELEGEIGDSHVGLQARMMSSAMRYLTAAVNESKCIVIFINQIRMKIGVM